MEPVPPTPDEAPRTGASCPSCRVATAADQRYCLSCGALVGDRRLDPIELLTAAPATGPVDLPPSGGAGASPRAVPLAAATAAIVVAGISGMLVTSGGSGNGARAAAVVASAAPAPAPTTTPEPAAAPAMSSDSVDDDSDPLPAEDPLLDDSLPADPLPTEPAAAPLDPAPVDDTPVDDGTGDEDAADEPAAESTPRVWLLALEGPQAAEAVERIEKQGVRLSGMQAVAADALANATALVGGTRPAAVTPVDPAAPVVPVDPAAPVAPGAPGGAGSAPVVPPTVSTPPAAPGVPADPAATATTPSAGATATTPDAEAAPSLPAALRAADRTWRAYVDSHPTDGKVQPGTCAAPPAGDTAAALLGSRLPFAAIPEIDCETSVTGLEQLGNDLSAGEDIPAFSYVAMGGCAAPERTAVPLPDAVEDAVATITASTEYQQDGMLVVTTVGGQDACTPGAPAPASGAPVLDPAAPPVVDPAAPVAPAAAVADAPTAVLRPAATPGKTVKAKLDFLALSRSMAEVLGVTPPGAAGDDAVPALELPGVPKQ